MKLWARIGKLLLVHGVCCAWWYAGAGRADDVMAVEDLRLPIEHYKDGRIKSQLMAGVAKLPERGDIEAWRVKLELYSKDGKLDTQVLTDECRYNRDKGITTSESNVRIEKSGIVITGTGLEWSTEQQLVKILDNVRVVFQRVAKEKQKKPKFRDDNVLSGGRTNKSETVTTDGESGPVRLPAGD